MSSNGYYPTAIGAPMRSFVSADQGGTIFTEYTGAVSADQILTGSVRALSSLADGVLVNVTGLTNPQTDVRQVLVYGYSTPSGSELRAVLPAVPVTAGGVTGWAAPPFNPNWNGSTYFKVEVRFRNAAAAVTVKSQQVPY